MTNYQKRKEKNDEYRSKIMRFTFQLSLGDTEVREWFEQQPEKGAYLKDLILRDKAERLGYREQKSAEPDKAGDYEIIQSIRMGGRVLLMGFNPKDETYMTCYQQYNFLGETMYPEALACKSYLEIAETFLNRLQAQVEKVKAFRAARNVPYAVLGAEACLPPSEESLQGKLIVLRPTSLAPEYRTADCQLGFALSGFGCTPGARGVRFTSRNCIPVNDAGGTLPMSSALPIITSCPNGLRKDWRNTKRSVPHRKKKEVKHDA